MNVFDVGAVTKGEGNIMEQVHAVFADVLFGSLSRSTLCEVCLYLQSLPMPANGWGRRVWARWDDNKKTYDKNLVIFPRAKETKIIPAQEFTILLK